MGEERDRLQIILVYDVRAIVLSIQIYVRTLISYRVIYFIEPDSDPKRDSI